MKKRILLTISLTLVSTHGSHAQLKLEKPDGKVLATHNFRSQFVSNAMENTGSSFGLILMHKKQNRFDPGYQWINDTLPSDPFVAQFHPHKFRVAFGLKDTPKLITYSTLMNKILKEHQPDNTNGQCTCVEHNPNKNEEIAFVIHDNQNKNKVYQLDTRTNTSQLLVTVIDNSTAPVLKFKNNKLTYGGNKIVNTFDTRRPETLISSFKTNGSIKNLTWLASDILACLDSTNVLTLVNSANETNKIENVRAISPQGKFYIQHNNENQEICLYNMTNQKKIKAIKNKLSHYTNSTNPACINPTLSTDAKWYLFNATINALVSNNTKVTRLFRMEDGQIEDFPNSFTFSSQSIITPDNNYLLLKRDENLSITDLSE